MSFRKIHLRPKIDFFGFVVEGFFTDVTMACVTKYFFFLIHEEGFILIKDIFFMYSSSVINHLRSVLRRFLPFALCVRREVLCTLDL